MIKLRSAIGHLARALYCNKRVIAIEKYVSWINCPARKTRNALALRRITLFKVDLEVEYASRNLLPGDIRFWREAVYKTLKLETVITYSVCVDCECFPHQIDPSISSHSQAIQRHATAAILAYETLSREIDRVRPEAAMILQGYILQNSILRHICIINNIPFYSFEITANKDRLVWDNVSGITVNKNLSHNYYWRWRDLIDPDESRSYCEQIISKTKSSKYAEHQSPDTQWKRPNNRPVLLYLGQVYTDSSILFGCTPELTPEVVMETLMTSALVNGYTLIIKLHPKENTGDAPNHIPLNRLTWRKMQSDLSISTLLEKLGDHVYVDQDNRFDTYSMIDMADVVVTINSQAGLESAIRGKNVILCGNAFYGGLGFTRDARSATELQNFVVNSIGTMPEHRWIEFAQVFYHIFFEKYCIDRSAKSVAQLLFSATKHGDTARC